ncbi:MAG: NAD(P)-dependent oxidoreductase [Candidatus Sericytochromatia bacterium]
MNITLIGTGLIGFNIAKRLCEFNNEIYVYNRTKEKALPLENYGAKVLDNLSDIDSDFIIGVLTDYSSYLDIFDKMTNLKNKTFIQMGTISSNENLELEKICKSMKCDYIEAPVLGSKKEAESGTLLIMSSGKENVYNKCKPIFEQISEKNLFVGDIGKASNLKLALNQLIASLSSAFSLSLGIVQKSEIDINIFMDILRSSSFYAPTFDKKLSNMINKDFENPNFPTKHLLKDVDLILDISKDFELKTNALEGVKSNIEKAIEIGLSDKDYSSVFMAIFNENI